MRNIRSAVIFIISIVISIILFLHFNSFFDFLEKYTFDKRLQLSTDIGMFNKLYNAASSDIVVINIDDIDYFELSKLPYSSFRNVPLKRTNWAKFIKYIESANPKVLLLDILFEGYEDETLGLSYNDIFLANTIGQYKNIVLSTHLTVNPEIDNSGSFSNLSETNYALTSTPLNVLNAMIKRDKNTIYLQHSPIPDIFVNNAIMGANNFVIANDGKIRYFKPIFKFIEGSKTYYIPSSALAAALLYNDINPEFLRRDNTLTFDTSVIPLTQSGNCAISWHGKDFSYMTIPFSAVVFAIDNNSEIIKFEDKEIPLKFLADKIVIVSQTAGNINLHNTALSNTVSGGQIHATIIDNIINDSNFKNYVRRKLIRNVPESFNYIFSFMLCVLIILLGYKLRSSFAFLTCSLGLICLFIYLAIIAFAYPDLRYNINIITPSFFALCIISFITTQKVNLKQNKKLKINELYGNFVSKKTLSKLIKTKNLPLEKSEKENVTVMICDIKHFNEYFQKYDSQYLMQNVNLLFNLITEEIYNFSGTIDKFVEDSVVAYWGAPISGKNDEVNAVKCAMKIKEKLEQKPIMLDNETILDIKIALHTDTAIIGCVKTENIEEYNILGPCINITNQIDKICSMTPKSFLISETTYNATKLHIHSTYKGEIKLPRSAKKLRLYEPSSIITK